MIPEEARAVYGKPVFETWKALEAWVQSVDLGDPGGDLRIDKTPWGAVVAPARPPAVAWPFEVRTGADAAVLVRPGLMAGRLPVVVAPEGGRYTRLDGRDADTGERVGEPTLPLAPAGPGGESYVVVRVRLDRATGDMRPYEQDPEALTVTSVSERSPRLLDAAARAAASDAAGYDAIEATDILAVVTWSGQRVERVDQVVMLHRRFAFLRGGGEERPDRVFFLNA